MDPAPFLRGCAWRPAPWAAYPRCDPRDHTRLPIDTWGCAQLPVGVRLEFMGGGRVEIAYETSTDDFGFRGPSAGHTFDAWDFAQVDAVLGSGVARFDLPQGQWIVYLPEAMKPVVTDVAGDIEPAPGQPRWLAYGDSIVEGWVASGPSGAWPAIAGRRFGLDHVNLGYAGSARGELASAEQIAALDADVISVSHGTNCWTRTPHSFDQMKANTAAFLQVLRDGHPDTPIVVCSPVIRPDAESTPNKLGATLADLRRAMEEAALERGDVTLVPGGDVLTAEHLADGIHPSDEGHEVLADVFGGAVALALAAESGDKALT